MPKLLQKLLMWLVTAAWVANLVIGYVYPERDQQAVNAAFMLVMGVLWGSARRKNGEDDPAGPAEALEQARRVVGDMTGRSPDEGER